MIDCHAHVFDARRFPFTAATYRPQPSESGTLADYLAVLDRHGVSNAVLVQPTSGYDADHGCLLDAIERGEGRLRGIARIPPARARQDVWLLDVPGICGVRLDLVNDGTGVASGPDFPWLLAALRERGAVLQVQCEGDQLAALLPAVSDADATIVVDHCGRPDPALGLSQPGFAALLELGRRGHYVKLCGAFRFSNEAYPHADVEPYVAALRSVFTVERCVWGSDWPFLRFAGVVDYPGVVDLARHWVGDPSQLDPAARTLFGFPPG
jgi:predicted TIM-barrel fold metal-dependent hydrolase